MIAIDIDKPTNCCECPFRERSDKNYEKNYCIAREGRPIKSDIFNKRADFCPIYDTDKVIQLKLRKHGEWQRKYNSIVKASFWECSNCKDDSPYKYKFCPNCGADMGDIE